MKMRFWVSQKNNRSGFGKNYKILSYIKLVQSLLITDKVLIFVLY